MERKKHAGKDRVEKKVGTGNVLMPNVM